LSEELKSQPDAEMNQADEERNPAEDEKNQDVELLLLSWTQMMAIELIAPDEDSQAAKADLAATLQSRFCITDIVLKERTISHYVVSYREHNKEKTIRFENDDVESIYDL
jgi:hypothetical protein